jgi:hypothetical protein
MDRRTDGGRRIDPRIEQALERARKLIGFALANHEHGFHILPLDPGEGVGGLVLNTTRQNDRNPATITLATTDAVIKNIRGKEALRDEYFMVVIKRETAERFESPIILDGEMR